MNLKIKHRSTLYLQVEIFHYYIFWGDTPHLNTNGSVNVQKKMRWWKIVLFTRHSRYENNKYYTTILIIPWFKRTCNGLLLQHVLLLPLLRVLINWMIKHQTRVQKWSFKDIAPFLGKYNTQIAHKYYKVFIMLLCCVNPNKNIGQSPSPLPRTHPQHA